MRVASGRAYRRYDRVTDLPRDDGMSPITGGAAGGPCFVACLAADGFFSIALTKRLERNDFKAFLGARWHRARKRHDPAENATTALQGSCRCRVQFEQVRRRFANRGYRRARLQSTLRDHAARQGRRPTSRKGRMEPPSDIQCLRSRWTSAACGSRGGIRIIEERESAVAAHASAGTAAPERAPRWRASADRGAGLRGHRGFRRAVPLTFGPCATGRGPFPGASRPASPRSRRGTSSLQGTTDRRTYRLRASSPARTLTFASSYEVEGATIFNAGHASSRTTPSKITEGPGAQEITVGVEKT